MDVSLTSLKMAFENDFYQCKMQAFKLFMFVLVTPADTTVFQSLTESFDDLHFLTGSDILVIAPSVKINGKPGSREEIADALIGPYFRNSGNGMESAFREFRRKQSEETYAFASHIGLPLDRLPCLVFFETLQSPTSYVTFPVHDSELLALTAQLRGMIETLKTRCLWREQEEAKRLETAVSDPFPFNWGLYMQQQIFKDQRKLDERKQRLSNLVVKRPVSSKYRAAISDLSMNLLSFLESSGQPKRLVNTQNCFRTLENGNYCPVSVSYLRKLRRRQKGLFPSDVEASFQNYMAAYEGEFGLREAIERSIKELEKQIQKTEKEMVRSVEDRRESLRDSLENLKMDIEACQESALHVLSTMPKAAHWRFERIPTMLSISGTNEYQVSTEMTQVKQGTLPHIEKKREELSEIRIDAILIVAVKVELDAVLYKLKPLVGQNGLLRVSDNSSKVTVHGSRMFGADFPAILAVTALTR